MFYRLLSPVLSTAVDLIMSNTINQNALVTFSAAKSRHFLVQLLDCAIVLLGGFYEK